MESAYNPPSSLLKATPVSEQEAHPCDECTRVFGNARGLFTHKVMVHRTERVEYESWMAKRTPSESVVSTASTARASSIRNAGAGSLDG